MVDLPQSHLQLSPLYKTSALIPELWSHLSLLNLAPTRGMRSSSPSRSRTSVHLFSLNNISSLPLCSCIHSSLFRTHDFRLSLTTARQVTSKDFALSTQTSPKTTKHEGTSTWVVLMEEKLLLEKNTHTFLSHFPTARLPDNEIIVACQSWAKLWDCLRHIY